MKLVATLIASLFAVTAFAADVKKDTKDAKDGAKPAVVAPSGKKAEPTKSGGAATDKKAEAVKK